MIELLKNLAIWLVSTICAFLVMYAIGSFCVMSLDITTWTGSWGRFGLVVLAGFIGGGCLECVHDAKRRSAMTPWARAMALDLHKQRHSHADY
ncbi:hypothetical protein D3C87_1496860 [compost metagenome]